MIYKCTNGYVVFTFESIQEIEMLGTILPLPSLVPLTDHPMSFIPVGQFNERLMVRGVPVSPTSVPVKSCADVIKGFELNGFTYSFLTNTVVPKETINHKVELSTNELGRYFCNFLLQPYSMVGLLGRATDFECVFIPSKGVFVFDYIRFVYE